MAGSVGLALGLVGGLASCSSSNEAASKPNTVEAPVFTPRVQKIAHDLLAFAFAGQVSTGKTRSNDVFFDVPVEGDGQLTFIVETERQDLNPQQVTKISIEKTTQEGDVFDIYLLRHKDKWSARCDNDVAVAGTGWEETSQKNVHLGAKTTAEDPELADIILDHTIHGAETVLDSIHATTSGTLGAVATINVCRFGMGGGI